MTSQERPHIIQELPVNQTTKDEQLRTDGPSPRVHSRDTTSRVQETISTGPSNFERFNVPRLNRKREYGIPVVSLVQNQKDAANERAGMPDTRAEDLSRWFAREL